MTRYRKKPVEVEAWQVGTEPVPDWVEKRIPYHLDKYGNMLAQTEIGMEMSIPIGSWLIRNDKGGAWVKSDHDFHLAYEVVE